MAKKSLETLAALEAVIVEARKLMRRGDTEWVQPDRIRKNFEQLGIRSEPSITIAMRTAFNEITAEEGNIRGETAYEEICAGERLYEFAWRSESLTVRMYLKFALFDGRLVIVNCHKSTVTVFRDGKKKP